MSETVEGKARYSTDLEFAAGSDTGSDLAPLVNKPSQLKADKKNASELISGIAKIATNAEFASGIDEID
jgi:hypothetical protein